MVRTNSLRPFQRLHNGVLIYLQLGEWPTDVPLPKGTTLVETGEGPFYPYWDLILEPDRTVEVVVGWFIIPPPLEDAIVWYRQEMAQRGWEERSERSSRLSQSAGLRFEHPVTGVRAVVDLRIRPHTKQTDVMIRRVVEHPWPPAKEETGQAGESWQPVPAGLTTVGYAEGKGEGLGQTEPGAEWAYERRLRQGSDLMLREASEFFAGGGTLHQALHQLVERLAAEGIDYGGAAGG